MPIPRVLFVCTGNAGRSQMAQAMLRGLRGAGVSVESAGVEPWAALHPMAERVMASRGVSMAGQFPKSAASVAEGGFDVVVTIGGPALAKLPHGLGTRALRIHWDLSDPADSDGTPDSQPAFLRTAAGIDQRMPALLALLDRLTPHTTAHARVGIGTGLWHKERLDPPRHLRAAAAAGFDAIELCVYMGPRHFDASDRAAVDTLRKAAADLGVAVWSIHSRDVGSLASADPAERQRQMDELSFCLDLAESLGSKVVVSHALVLGNRAPGDGEADRFLQESLARLHPRALASAATIGFENGFLRPEAWPTAGLFTHMAPWSPAAFGFVYDTGHAHIANAAQLIDQQAGRRLLSLHLNDNDGRQDIHRVPTEGSVDWALVQQTLRKGDYAGCHLYELLPGNEAPEALLPRALAAHRKLWP